MCNKWLANSRHKGLAHQRILVLNKGLCVPNSVAHGCHADAVKGDTQAVKGDTQAEHGVHIYSALLQHQPVLHNRSLHLLQHSDQHEQGLQQSVSSHLHIDWQVVPWLQSAEETCTERGWLET